MSLAKMILRRAVPALVHLKPSQWNPFHRLDDIMRQFVLRNPMAKVNRKQIGADRRDLIPPFPQLGGGGTPPPDPEGRTRKKTWRIETAETILRDC